MSAERIRTLRKKSGMNQSVFAEKVGISQSMLCQLERGTKVPTLPLAVQIANVLGCSLNDLI